MGYRDKLHFVYDKDLETAEHFECEVDWKIVRFELLQHGRIAAEQVPGRWEYCASAAFRHWRNFDKEPLQARCFLLPQGLLGFNPGFS